MTDDPLSDLLGGGDEAAQAEATPGGPARAEAFAAAVAARLAGADPEVAKATRGFLKRQSRLLELQAKSLEDENELRMSLLRGQDREARMRRLGQRIRVGLQLFTVFAFTVLGVGGMVMLADAFASKSVIVEPFDAPPALAQRGLTGKVVASGLLDELTRLRAATRSPAAKRHMSNAWTGDIRIEVPQAGISIGEVDRALKARLGHDLHIDGDLVQTEAGGLALTVRGDGVLPKTFTGAAGDLGKLTTQAAEYIYGQSQPSLYVGYLVNAYRNGEAIAFSRAAFPTATGEDRPYILNQWGNAVLGNGGGARQALTLYEASLKLKPDYWTAYNNVMNSQWGLGDEQDAWRTGEAMRKAAGGRPGKAVEVYYQNIDLLTWNLQASRAAIVADNQAHGGVGTLLVANGPALADLDARLHDPAAAELDLATGQEDARDPTIAAIGHFVRGWIAAEAGDTARAASEMEAFQIGYADPVVSGNYPGYGCWIAPAEEAAGHPDKADAAIRAGGHFVDCQRFRGDILDHRGDWPSAQRAYAAAVAMAPDLPAGFYSWGLALARHGDLEGAKTRLDAASQRGPHWADPLKAIGDILARQGRRREALAAYDRALRYAPAWTALRQARAAAARR